MDPHLQMTRAHPAQQQSADKVVPPPAVRPSRPSKRWGGRVWDVTDRLRHTSAGTASWTNATSLLSVSIRPSGNLRKRELAGGAKVWCDSHHTALGEHTPCVDCLGQRRHAGWEELCLTACWSEQGKGCSAEDKPAETIKLSFQLIK
jgi:hypothetical protein